MNSRFSISVWACSPRSWYKNSLPLWSSKVHCHILKKPLIGAILTQCNSVYIPKLFICLTFTLTSLSYPCLDFSCAVTLWCSTTNMFQTYVTLHMHDAYPTCLTLFDLIILTIICKEHKFLCSYFAIYIQPPVTFCLLHARGLNVPFYSTTLSLSLITKELLKA